MFNDQIIKVTFFISLLGHLLLLGLSGFNLGFPQAEKPEEITVKIKIERPPLLPKIDVIGKEKKLKEVIEKPKPLEPEPEFRPEEEAVMVQPVEESIEDDIEVVEPAQEAMLRYQDMIKQRIEQVRRYPSWAKKQGIAGAVHLNFVVLANGLAKDIKIIYSSSSKILDTEAGATIQRANPFPSIPQEISRDFVVMEVIIVFALD